LDDDDDDDDDDGDDVTAVGLGKVLEKIWNLKPQRV
jgi:hypothetical protein